MKRLLKKMELILRVKTLRAVLRFALLSPFALHAPPASAATQLPDFTYQGQLQQNGQPASGNYNLTFALFNASVGGGQVGSTIVENAFPVVGGLFTTSLAFPGAFTGTQLWLQVTVNGVALTPRTAVSTTPVAQYALTGAIADGSVTRASLNGSTQNGNISFSVSTGNCSNLTLSVNGAQVGDAVVLSFNGATPPAGIVFSPLSVTAAGTVKTVACNLSGANAAISSLAVTIQTFR